MSLLSLNSTPAERERGCVFAENFVDDAKVALNSGTVTKNPQIDVGAGFDGTEDKITYPVVLGVKAISFRITLATTTEDVIKLSSSHSLTVSGGTLTATGFTSPTYWINGSATQTITASESYVTIITSTAFDADDFVVGEVSGFGEFTIKELRIFNNVLTLQEHTDYYNNDIYKYRNQQTLHLPMTMENHDPTNVRMLDVSGNGNHATFGDGSTSSTYPTKLSKRGYSYDGGDYSTGSGSGVFNTAETSIAIMFTPDFATDEDVIRYLFDASVSLRYFIYIGSSAASNALIFYLGNMFIANVAEAAYKPYWHVGCENVLVVSGASGDTSAWLNGKRILANDNTAWMAKNPVNYFIGSNYADASEFKGSIKSLQVWDRALTPLQVQDLTMRLLKQVNKT